MTLSPDMDADVSVAAPNTAAGSVETCSSSVGCVVVSGVVDSDVVDSGVVDSDVVDSGVVDSVVVAVVVAPGAVYPGAMTRPDVVSAVVTSVASSSPDVESLLSDGFSIVSPLSEMLVF
jgi:hypothetical protein